MATASDSPALSELSSRTDAMLRALEAMVSSESPSADLDAVNACADVVASIGRELLGDEPTRAEVGGHPYLEWTFGSPRVLLLGHLDTVWPRGTVARWPFDVHGDRATGPGSFDMKAGLTQLFFALTTLSSLDGVQVLVTSDEEIGSPSSRELIEARARASRAVLVLEPSAGGALKIARKGVSTYELIAHGRASHAGLDPESGINAAVEISHQVIALESLATARATVTPTVVAAGTTTNTVPARASCHVDVRAATSEEQQRIDEQIRSLPPFLDGSRLEVRGGPNRPPLSRDSSADLFSVARGVADSLSLPQLDGVEVGGGSDGNLTAGIGVPTLDGLGAVGGNAHAEGEWISVPHMAQRAALVAGLVSHVTGA